MTDVMGVLGGLARGQLLEKLADAVVIASDDAADSQQKVKVTLVLDIVPQPKIGDRAVEINESIKRTNPSSKPLGAIRYAVAGGLHRQDIRQQELPHVREVTSNDDVRDVAGPATETREA